MRRPPRSAAAALALLETALRPALRAVLRRVPRDPALLAFGAPLDRFADNPAYLFLHLSQHSRLRCVWVSGSDEVVARLRRAGLRAERRWSVRGVLTCVRAGWFVYGMYATDVNRRLHDGARLFCLWHGIPLKAIGRDAGGARHDRAARDELRPPDVLLSPSAFISRRCFASAFDLPAERCLNAGYPRTDHLCGCAAATPPSRALVRDRALWEHVAAHPFVVGYFPTWRDGATPAAGLGGLSLDRLAAAVAARGGLLVFKSHYLAPETAMRSPSLVALAAGDDLNAYLPLCTALVTDYSSVAFDYLLLDRPILYYVPDLDEYRARRGLYFEPDEMMPGPLLHTAEELYAAVAELPPGAVEASTSDAPGGSHAEAAAAAARRAALAARLWDHRDGGASVRVQAFLEREAAVR